MKMASNGASLNIAETLVDKGFELAQREGLAALTTRRLAAEAGVSSSAITHQFGTMRALREAVAHRTHKALVHWRAVQRSNLDRGLGATTPTGFAIGMAADLCGPNRNLALVAAELVSLKDFNEFLKMEREAAIFWSRCFEQLGCTSEQAVIWTDFMFGMIPLALMDHSAASLFTWCPMLAQRLADRLAGRSSFPEEASPFPPPRKLLDPPAQAGARKLLEATIALIGEIGVERLTHRNIAERAGLSVGAATYFFASKNDIIIAAVQEVLRRARQRVTDSLREDADLSAALAPGGDLYSDIHTVLALEAAAARYPDLTPLTPMLRDMRGPMAKERLRQDQVKIDKVDAILWSTIFLGLLHAARIPKRRVARELENRATLYRQVIFHADRKE